MSTKLTKIENGPLIIQSEDVMTLNDEIIGKKQAICMCGKSKDGIFCDGSHKQKETKIIQFSDNTKHA